MDRYGPVLLIGLNLLLTFACISSQDASSLGAGRAGARAASAVSPPLLPSLLTGASLANEINHNGSVNALEVNTADETITQQTVSQSQHQQQHYYYQLHSFRPKVNLRISSEYGIVRQQPAKEDDYYAYGTVGASSSPNSIIDSKDKDKVRYSEKVIELQQSTLESPPEEYVEQYFSSEHERDNPTNHNQLPRTQPSGSLQSMRIRSYDAEAEDDPAASSSLLDTSNSVLLSASASSNDKSEKSNAIVENEPSSASASNDKHNNGDDGDGEEDDYSNYYHYSDDDYQQQQYAHSFPDYTDEELLENVAELHNQYFVKTKPRDVITQIETSLSPFEVHGHSYKDTPLEQRLVNETSTAATPTTMQDSSDFYENMSTAINKANNPHSMKFELPPSGPTMTTAEEESTKLQDESMYGLMMTPTIASNLIEDVTRKFGSTDSTSIPGMPGIDYPILDEIPQTSFDCQKQRYKGFFADVETKCQAWHYCDFIDGHSTFLCPNGTLFSQTLLTCDWWFNVRCEESQQLYVLNERLYRYIKAPKLSFPEDYHGPHVDDWLLEQLQLGLLPKIKKKVKDKVVIQANYS